MTPQTIPDNIRLIENLRGKKEFKNSTFWIIGSDPNLDYYPDDFFNNKFTIAVNASCIAFPESTFFYMNVGEEKKLELVISKYPGCLKKTIMGIGIWKNWGLEPIYFKMENKALPDTPPDYEALVKRLLGNGSCDFIKVRTSVHIAIFIAVALGAKKIILVGCSHRTSKGKNYAHKRGIGDIVWEKSLIYVPAFAWMRRDTIQLAKVFRNYGIEVIRHRFDEGKNEFLFEEIK